MKHHTLSGLLALSLLFGCSSSEDIVPDVPPSELYSDAQISLQSGNWLTAIEKLEALDSRYPFGAYSEQVQLDLIYAYYKNDDLALGLATIERFTRLNPTHEKMDWVLYMRGLTHMAQDRNFMHDLFNVDRSDRDPEPVKAAFADFKKLLQRYPASPYAEDAHKRLFALKNRLAEYDLATADFYLRREAWIAAINRTQELQKTYPDTEAARKSLRIQLEAYKQLKLDDAIERTEKLIALNPE
ncbi:outer membrane protein assembly factor BamD [Vibrio aestuarianus]|uniref:Outer membrane protein assembly factor BamD n=1 Tax=Vibrio aestuarianus TaxID=28171 RepID=A0ABM9FSH0_9VIBR|nr:outer membrane protein assembly factor BamD [Vibrio aestuarianus]MDE1210428.1 outer membrane protein assembly factor BamD [Vibrio aestuarianus]MDE1215281.1 outer membrane protein assembly factor BamD [Vibrio aestuarianus]MDE1217652.1 outer membrane protein assembly factor BamD [Vibrio aestuarianus]MDE1220047.1 outer membrane protein assembly factor BamD [Vibrio aestuarianus]MDE1226185.1 outer membrane protein assembly factor BamD [Vibrio aestuarianus]